MMNDSNDEFATPGDSVPPEPALVDAPPPVIEQPVQAFEPAAPAAPPQKPGGIPKAVWFIGGGCLLAICCAIVLAVLAYLGITFFGGGQDPISSVVPSNAMMYMSVDLTQTQSQNLADIVAVAQEMADADTGQTMNEALDEMMSDELNMSFTEDVAPWIGRHAALVVTDGNFSSGDVELMIILEARNKGKADEFVSKFVGALEENQYMEFEQREQDGITYYIDSAEASYEEDTIILRSGKFIYVSNSESAVFDSISLQKKDSLGALDSYKQALGVLPKNRLATIFVSGESFVDLFSQTMNEVYGYGMAPVYDMSTAVQGVAGMAISVSAEDAGLRMDFATIYDMENLPEYQREILNAGYLKPTTDALVPADTFIFMGVNSAKSPFSSEYADNPLYSGDVAESFDLLEQEYGIRIQDLFDMLSGEFAVAVGPANDGLFPETSDVNIGLTVLARTNNDQEFNDWFDNILEVAFAQDSYVEYDVQDATVGDYSLKELSIDDGYQKVSTLIYGADNGYIVFGTSQSMLESGFTTDQTLANNETYRRTWQSFPAGSMPYMYVNVDGLMDFLVDAASDYEVQDYRLAQQKLEKLPVVAMSLNKTSGNVQSLTIIAFIDKGK